MYDVVILISIDTLRADGIACNPLRLWDREYALSRELRTPTLDELAGGGAFFTNAIAAAPYTSASHATILTGRWPPNHGSPEFFGPPIAAPTVFTAARRHGFRTLLKTDFPVMMGSHLGFDRDVDRFIIEDDDAFLDDLAAAERCCALLHFGSAHIPYGFHNSRYGGVAYQNKVEELEAEVGQAPRAYPADVLNETYRTAEDLELLLRYKRAVIALYADGRYARLFELYLEGIEHFCRTRFARVWERLLAATAKKRRLVILFGDHGEAFHEEAYGHFNTVDEGVLRVPLVFWGDDVVPAAYDGRVRTVDIAPTVLDLQGWSTAAGALDGVSLVPSLRQRRAPAEHPAFAQAYVARADQAFRAQKQLFDGEPVERVDHVLYREAAYGGEHKVSRRHYVAGTENRAPVRCRPEVVLERFDDRQRPRRVSDDAKARELLLSLDAYGASGTRAPRGVEIPASLRQHLQNHGYFERD